MRACVQLSIHCFLSKLSTYVLPHNASQSRWEDQFDFVFSRSALWTTVTGSSRSTATRSSCRQPYSAVLYSAVPSSAGVDPIHSLRMGQNALTQLVPTVSELKPKLFMPFLYLCH